MLFFKRNKRQGLRVTKIYFIEYRFLWYLIDKYFLLELLNFNQRVTLTRFNQSTEFEYGRVQNAYQNFTANVRALDAERRYRSDRRIFSRLQR